jgi:mannose-1-phosphate guanylyltransferase
MFLSFPTVSIDYGLMEKAKDVAVVKASFTWDDIGSWTALERTKDADDEHNIIEGKSMNLDTNNSIIINKSKGLTVTTLGLENMTVVVTDDSIMICPKNKTQDVKKIVAELHNQNMKEIL